MAQLVVKDTTIRTLTKNGVDYICITDIARQKNPVEPKDVVKNWMRVKNTLEYLGLWESLNNPAFKGVEFDPILKEAGSNSFTMSPSRWVELTGAIEIRECAFLWLIPNIWNFVNDRRMDCNLRY